MKFHLMSLLYATFITIGLFVILAAVSDEGGSYCDVKFNESVATMPCTELNHRVYEVTL